MTDGREFEWSDKATSDLQGFLNDILNQVYRGHQKSSQILAWEVLSLLKPFVKEALAAEYDRGYETALNMEAELGLRVERARLAKAWDEGFEEGKDYGAYLEGGYGDYPLESNPYV